MDKNSKKNIDEIIVKIKHKNNKAFLNLDGSITVI